MLSNFIHVEMSAIIVKVSISLSFYGIAVMGLVWVSFCFSRVFFLLYLFSYPVATLGLRFGKTDWKHVGNKLNSSCFDSRRMRLWIRSRLGIFFSLNSRIKSALTLLNYLRGFCAQSWITSSISIWREVVEEFKRHIFLKKRFVAGKVEASL